MTRGTEAGSSSSGRADRLRSSSERRSSSRGSSGSNRSSHHRHHRHHRRRSRCRFKRKESNFLAAVCSMFVMVLLCTALTEPQWFSLSGGSCHERSNPKNPLQYMGVNQFFYIGHFYFDEYNHLVKTEYIYGPSNTDILVDCVTPEVVGLMRTIIALCFLGIIFSLVAFLMDLIGPSPLVLKFLRRNAVFNIITVVVCVMVNGFCYRVTQLMLALEREVKLHPGNKVQVQFSVSFYLVAAGGAMSVVASACNLLRKQPLPEQRDDREPLLDDYDGMEAAPLGPPDTVPPASNLPPPPAYTP